MLRGPGLIQACRIIASRFFKTWPQADFYLAGMNLNHLNLVVPDVEQATTFFEQQLGFRASTRKPGIHILRDDADCILALSHLR